MLPNNYKKILEEEWMKLQREISLTAMLKLKENQRDWVWLWEWEWVMMMVWEHMDLSQLDTQASHSLAGSYSKLLCHN
jgi:hypothetical protein